MRMPRFDGADVRYDDVTALPAVEIDGNGFAVRPWTPADASERVWSLEERKVRFLLFWNWSCGNKTMACQEAGISRRMADEWMKEPAFIAYIEMAKEEIADRLMLRVAQRTGLLPMPEGVKVHDGSLYGLAKKYRPEMFGDTGEQPTAEPVRPDSNIPRPKPAQAAQEIGVQHVHPVGAI